jgi:hypothetical protein
MAAHPWNLQRAKVNPDFICRGNQVQETVAVGRGGIGDGFPALPALDSPGFASCWDRAPAKAGQEWSLSGLVPLPAA